MIITIKTQSQVTDYPIKAVPIPPSISINGSMIESPIAPPSSPVGYQAVIMEDPKLNIYPNILYNNYFNLSTNSISWYKNYINMYDIMFQEIISSHYAVLGYLLILCSFGAGNNIPPTPSMYKFLTTVGASDGLEYWETHCDPGSQMSNDKYWMVSPVNYMLIGRFGYGAKQGFEEFQKSSAWNMPIQSTYQTTI
ncbi:hypothetical protein C8E03_102447 [Lachnotalea glycerini]|uniref:Uncharacterized protein n=1 Tax=Lachnotalea glycerini TaxID=1763509 RepID=A0A318EVU6_9FIRM|nr:hypothetical protein [Lachnotalea glycerini]PXV93672.1 hypothetical protein C8E03_102447 [Lachnotalea glycerini]